MIRTNKSGALKSTAPARITLAPQSFQRNCKGIESLSFEDACAQVQKAGFLYCADREEAEALADAVPFGWLMAWDGCWQVAVADGAWDLHDESDETWRSWERGMDAVRERNPEPRRGN